MEKLRGKMALCVKKNGATTYAGFELFYQKQAEDHGRKPVGIYGQKTCERS
jgi:hypothetical protein